MYNKLNASQIYEKLMRSYVPHSKGIITFDFAGTSVTINTTDIVGATLQSWFRQWLIDNNIYFYEPENTQEFPDFYLDGDNMLEVKAFNFRKTPAFDIANFESYCDSLQYESHRLNADYLIFGYSMYPVGHIKIDRIWLKKIWEIAGTSSRFPLKTQVKRNVIYNIRPSSDFKFDRDSPFRNKDELVKAIYETLALYRGDEVAEQWLNNVMTNYMEVYNRQLII